MYCIFIKKYPGYKEAWVQTTGSTIITIHTQHYALERWIIEFENV